MMENKEIWKDCKGYEGLYQVSNMGRVWSIKRQIYMKANIVNGYYQLTLVCKNGKAKNEKIHRLVALNFIGEPPKGKTMVNHRDENKLNNHVENLEWVDSSYNNNYGSRKEKCHEAMLNHPKKSKPLYQYDLDGNLLAIYPSGAEVERLFGFGKSNLYKCARGEYETAYGYKWSFVA